MNLSELVTSALPSGTVGASIAAAQGEKSLKTGLLEEFSAIFAVAAPVLEEGLTTMSEQSSETMDGSDMPEGTGKILPDLAITPLPQQVSIAGLPDTPDPKGETDRKAHDLPLASARPVLQPAAQPGTAPARNGMMAGSDAETLVGEGIPLPAHPRQPTDGPRPEVLKHTGPAASSEAVRIPDQQRAEMPQPRSNPLSQDPVGTAPLAPRSATASVDPAAREIPVEQILRTNGRITMPPADGTTEDANTDLPAQRPIHTAANSTAQSAPQMQLQAATPTAPMALASELANAIGSANRVEPAQALAPQRHDFTQVVDRLAEARELAQPGRAEMQVSHREFGAVSMQFQIAGSALKVVLANADAGFAPAVQTALAEQRVNAPSEMLRTDAQPQQAVSQSHSSPGQGISHASASSTAQSSTGQQGTQAQPGANTSTSGQTPGDGHQNQGDPQRTQRVQAQPHEVEDQRDSDSERGSTALRDSALFA